jgi:O-antigen/teichoic acid export membrane protein
MSTLRTVLSRRNPAESGGARSFLLGLGWNGSSTLALQGARFLVTLLAARRAGPVSWGVWAIISVVITYAPNLSLGVLNAMNREVPMLLVRCQSERAAEVISTVRRFILAIVGAVTLGMLAAAWLADQSGLRFGLAAGSVLVGLTVLLVFEQCIMRCENRFDDLGRTQFVLAGSMLCTIPLATSFGLSGFIIGQTLAIAISIAFCRRLKPGPFALGSDWTLILSLARSGFPTLFVGLVFTVFNTVDRILVGWAHGQIGLGIYGFAISLSLVAQFVPTLIADQTYPAMLRDWGANGSIVRARRWMWRQIGLSTVTTGLVCAVSAVVLPPFVRHFFPTFGQSIRPAQLLLLSPVGLSLAFGPANFLNTVNRRGRYIAVLFAVIGVYVAIGAAMVGRQASLSEIAGLSSLSSLTFGLGMLAAAVVVPGDASTSEHRRSA